MTWKGIKYVKGKGRRGKRMVRRKGQKWVRKGKLTL
jgi:hypothetical protein